MGEACCSFKISVPNGDDLYVAKLREEYTSNKGFNWLIVVPAINWFANKKINLDEGLAWANSFIDRNIKYFPIYNAKGNILTAMGKQADADAVMKEATNLPDATANQIVNYGRQLITNKREKDALPVMETATKRFPTNGTALTGMARAYSANNDHKKALKFLQDALKNETVAANKTTIEGLIKKAEKGESIN